MLVKRILQKKNNMESDMEHAGKPYKWFINGFFFYIWIIIIITHGLF